jgi:hypothetical protein
LFAFLQRHAGSFNALKDKAEEEIAEKEKQNWTENVETLDGGEEAHELILVPLVRILMSAKFCSMSSLQCSGKLRWVVFRFIYMFLSGMATRFLQTIRSHSKISQDVSLANKLIKKSLEVLVIRVKAMLAAIHFMRNPLPLIE